MATHNKPIQQIREGVVQGSIWLNESPKGSFYNMTVVRTYKDEQDRWKDSISFGFFDMFNLLLVVLKAYEWMRRNPLAVQTESNLT